jgi:hypothetical protein
VGLRCSYAEPSSEPGGENDGPEARDENLHAFQRRGSNLRPHGEAPCDSLDNRGVGRPGAGYESWPTPGWGTAQGNGGCRAE